MTTLLKTPLHDWHVSHKAKMAPFAGWDMPIQYTGIIAEHVHTREKASVFDICHMGEFILKGPGAKAALAKAVTHNLDTLKPARCRYGFLLNEAGGIIDDLIVYHIEEDHYMIVVNAACREGDYREIAARLPSGLSFTDVSDEMGKIDIQGPASVDALEHILPGPWRQIPYFGIVQAEFDGAPLIVSRTGYTGELGFELYLPLKKTLALWEACIADKDVEPAGLGARDTLRLEVGLPLYGQDLDTAHTPAEAGYGGMLSSTAEYVGKARATDIRESLTALSIPGRRSARHNDEVFLDGKKVGIVTSASFAPSLGNAVALAYIAKDFAEAENYTIAAAKTELVATRVALPFYTKGTARMKF
ncbi:glycine cleavage system aminomethyltransferase GcvT [Desulfovibrio sp. OttesenSCG-928-O18]|nr:glycine cleavage system aminomethyltransferase GcvT [Desulfovibrio sp. OttesenSCG-928-O18]